MKTSVVVGGIVLLIIGVALLAYGLYYPTSSAPSVVQAVPLASRNIDAGGTWSFGVSLQKGEALNGTAQILDYNQSAGPIFLYIQNESTFIYWGGCAPCALPSSGYSGLANYTISNGIEKFSWTVPYTGSFYFSFDNENYGQLANATFAATGAMPSSGSGTMVNNSLVYAGAIVAVIGAIVTGIGVTIRGSPSSRKEPAPTTKPPAAV